MARGIRPKLSSDKQWERFAKQYRVQFPTCVACGRPANTVDHIRARRFGGAMYDPRNLQSMCASCHSRKTHIEMMMVRSRRVGRPKRYARAVNPLTGLRT